MQTGSESVRSTPGSSGKADAVAEVLSGHPGAGGRRWLGWVALVAFIAFVVDTYLVLSGALLRPFDIPVAVVVQSANWGPIAILMRLTNASGGWGQVVLAVAGVIALYLYDRRAGALMALGSVASAMDSFVKISVARHRPTADLVQVLDPSNGYSYPSGHAVFFTWFAFMLAAALAPRLRPPRRIALWVGALLLVVIACLGRVWAGVHWPSDVIGGFLLGVAWSACVLWLAERFLPDPGWPLLARRPMRSRR